MGAGGNASLVLGGGVGFCNAVRRSLTGDVPSWAPYEVVVRENSSCQTDEFLAHRIGLIPFRRTGEGESLDLSGEGPSFLRIGDAVGPAFEPVFPQIEVMQLAAGQRIDLTIHFDRKTGASHARYAPCAAVGMEKADGDGRCRLAFEMTGAVDAREAVLAALDALEARVDDALQRLAHQPATPPKSMC